MVPPPKEVVRRWCLLLRRWCLLLRSCATMVAKSCILRNYGCEKLHFAKPWLQKYALYATMVAQNCILRNHSCANLNFAQQWCSTYVDPPHVEPPHAEPPYVEPQHVEPPHMWSLHMWSLHMDFLANLIKFARCLANYNNFARSPCKFEKFLCNFSPVKFVVAELYPLSIVNLS